MKKIRITQKQAIMLENLNKKKVIKITESQYKRLIENLSEVDIDKSFTNAMPSKLRPEFLADRKALSEGLWESFINELYNLNESSENTYETLIKLMEACGYVENRKLSKLKFEGNKNIAKNVILGGLEKLHETGSPFMAMEAMEKEFDLSKDMEKNELFKGLVEKWLENNDNQSVKLAYNDGNYIEAWKLARNANTGKTLQNPRDMEIVQSKMTEEESDVESYDLCGNTKRVVGKDILNYEPFKSLPDTREQATNLGAQTTSLRNVNDELQVIFSKQDFFDYNFEYNGKTHFVPGFIDTFKRKYGEEPIFCNIHVNTDRNIPNADIINLPKKDSFDPRPYLGEKEIDEVSSTTGSLGLSSPINPIGYEPKNMETESKIYEALNALKKK